MPLAYGQVGMIALGVLVMSSEYTGGQIRSSLASVPSRGLLLAVKAAVLALVAVLVAVPTTVASFALTQAGLGPYGITLDEATSSGGSQMFIQDSPAPGMLGPVAGGAVMAAWTLALVSTGYVAFTRRDA